MLELVEQDWNLLANNNNNKPSQRSLGSQCLTSGYAFIFEDNVTLHAPIEKKAYEMGGLKKAKRED